MAEPHADVPDGVFSVLDTDLYKLTMQCAILQHFPETHVEYKFTNRTAEKRLSRAAFQWLERQVEKLANVHITDDEVAWLKKTCPYLSDSYLSYLQQYRFRPDQHVELAFAPVDGAPADDITPGDVDIVIRGRWVDTILYEIPLLALTSEAYFKFVDRDWTHDYQLQRAQDKGEELLRNGCVFSEFGTRRRRDYRTHDQVMQGLVAAQRTAETNGAGWQGKFSGTSNVHLAMRFGVAPIGTVAHEWFMGIAAATDNYAEANEVALRLWIATYGRGVLAIALTDTFGTAAFLRAFARPAPQSGHTDPASAADASGHVPSYAEVFAGVRQDSGDPLEFIRAISRFYDTQGLKKKVVVFSDSLNVDRCVTYKHATDAVGLTPSFGIGTFFTNDFRCASDSGTKSTPLNIVIKLSAADGRPAVKLSDDVGKNMGDSQLIDEVKAAAGYEDRKWDGADEAHRWDQ